MIRRVGAAVKKQKAEGLKMNSLGKRGRAIGLTVQLL
jgi:hypothetical protein